jgi:hypothetical protein
MVASHLTLPMCDFLLLFTIDRIRQISDPALIKLEQPLAYLFRPGYLALDLFWGEADTLASAMELRGGLSF